MNFWLAAYLTDRILMPLAGVIGLIELTRVPGPRLPWKHQYFELRRAAQAAQAAQADRIGPIGLRELRSQEVLQSP